MLQYTSFGNYHVISQDNSLKLYHLISRYLIVGMLQKKLSQDLKNQLKKIIIISCYVTLSYCGKQALFQFM